MYVLNSHSSSYYDFLTIHTKTWGNRGLFVREAIMLDTLDNVNGIVHANETNRVDDIIA
jgi:hypothetical protein